MSRYRWISLCACLVAGLVLVAGWQGVSGQTKKPKPAAEKKQPAGISPEQCFSADTVAYFRLDGTKAHQADWEKTAAYKALIKSGLAASIDKWLGQLGDQEPQAELGRKFLWQILENGFSFGVIPPDDPQSGDVELTVVFHHGAALVDDFRSVLPPDLPVGVDQFDRNGQKKSRITAFLPGVENGALSWWAEDDHLVLTASVNGAETAINTLEGTLPNITTHPDWKRRNSLEDGQVLTGVAWVDVKRLVEKYAAIEIPEGTSGNTITVGRILEILGVDNVTEISGKQGYDGKVCVSRTDILHTGPRRGVVKLLEGKPMTLDSLPPLPEYSTAVMSCSLDTVEIYDAVIALVNSVQERPETDEQDRQAFAEALNQANEFVGGSLRDDLLANLGPVHALFNDPTNGIGGFGFGYAVKSKNPDKLRDILEVALEQIPEPFNDQQPRVIRTEKDGREYISFGQPPIPFFPTLTIDEDWLVVGLTTQTAESFILRKQGELDPWTPTKEQQELLEKLPKEFVSITLTDPREMIRAANQYLPFMQAAVASGPPGAGPQFPMIELPSGERITKPMFPTAIVATVDEEGIHYYSRQALPGLPIFGSPDSLSTGSVAIGVALLLPAVQQAREAARRTQSKNNLKQIGLALHNYHDTFNRFPSGVVGDGPENPEDSLSWYAEILPYIDQAPLYNRLNKKDAWDDDDNKALGKNAIITLMNPSAVSVELEDGLARADYAGVAGLGADGPETDVDDQGAGVFAYHRATRIGDITDGTSNTVMVGDISKKRGPWIQGGESTIRPFVNQPYIGGEDGWGGNHVGGGHFLFADGSVRFVSQNIDANTMEALVTIQGGEVLGDF